MAEIGENAEGLPAATALIPGPLVQRQVRHRFISTDRFQSIMSLLPNASTSHWLAFRYMAGWLSEDSGS